MQFVNPLFLYGFLALAIPIIIHLFNFRKFKKVWFTNVKLLEEFTYKTRRESKLRHLIVLILRLLAISCLVLAFAQPFIKDKETTNKFAGASSAISVYIDNSFSMETSGNEGTMFEEAKKRALEVALSFKTSDLFSVTTNDFEGIHQRWVSRDEFIELVDRIKLSSSVRSLSEVYQRQKDIFQDTDKDVNKIIFLISDFQKPVCDFHNFAQDTAISIMAVPLIPESNSNIYIDSIWINSPIIQAGQNIEITAIVKNSSNTDMEKIPLKLSIDGTQKAVSSLDINANSSAETKIVFTLHESGVKHGFIEVTDSPVNYDDKLFFSINVSNTIPVLSLYSDNIKKNYIKSLFASDSTFMYNEYNEHKIDYSSFSNYNLIVLNALSQIQSGLSQELQKFVSNGGSIVIFPSFEDDLSSYNEFLQSLEMDNYLQYDTVKTKVANINIQHPLFNDVFEKIPDNIDLPVVFSYYPMTKNFRSNREVLLKLQNEESFLSVQTYKTGKVYLSAVALTTEASNFPHHAIFVPALYRMALLVEPERALYYYTASENTIPLKGNIQGTDMVFRLKKTDSDFEIVPGISENVGNINISTYGQIKEAGNYDVVLDKDVVCGLAFNYDRRESVLEYYSQSELTKVISQNNLKYFKVLDASKKELTKTISDVRNGIILWKIFVILALIFFVSEILVLRFGR